jgi:predicted GIY-YIG superfamily endonuclease
MEPKCRGMLNKMKAKVGGPSPAPAAAPAAVWSLYILECRDGSFYTGVTNDIDRRIRKHREGTASRYTRTRRPVVLVYQEACGTRSRALERECAVKALSRQRKEELIAISNSSDSEDP